MVVSFGNLKSPGPDSIANQLYEKAWNIEIWLGKGIARFLENEVIQMIPISSNPQEIEGK